MGIKKKKEEKSDEPRSGRDDDRENEARRLFEREQAKRLTARERAVDQFEGSSKDMESGYRASRSSARGGSYSRGPSRNSYLDGAASQGEDSQKNFMGSNSGNERSEHTEPASKPKLSQSDRPQSPGNLDHTQPLAQDNFVSKSSDMASYISTLFNNLPESLYSQDYKVEELHEPEYDKLESEPARHSSSLLQIKIELCLNNPSSVSSADILSAIAVLDTGCALSWVSTGLLKAANIRWSQIRPIREKDWKMVYTFNGILNIRHYVIVWWKSDELLAPWKRHEFYVFNDDDELACFGAEDISRSGWLVPTLENTEHVQEIVYTALEAPTGNILNIPYAIPTTFKNALLKLHKKENFLDGVMAINGNDNYVGEKSATANRAEVVDARNYIQTTWPKIGTGVLDAISWGLEGLNITTQVTTNNSNIMVVHSQLFDQNPNIILSGPRSIQENFCSLFTWLYATVIPVEPHVELSLQLNRQGAVCLSRTALSWDSTSDPESPTLRVAHYHTAQNLNSCWQNLFRSASVVPGFPLIAPWSTGTSGLRMTFSQMVTYAAVERCTFFEGVPILYGISTLVVPVKEAPDGSAIQWHLEVDLDGQVEFSRIHVKRHAEMRGCSFEELSQKMAVLGWVDKAAVAVGTTHLSVSSIAISGATPISHELLRVGVVNKFDVQVGGSSPFSFIRANIGRDVQKQFANCNLRFEVPKTFSAMLQKPSRSVVVYDKEKETAWQLPMLNVLLHMAHYYKLKYGHTWSEKDHTQLPAAKLDFDGGEAAYKAISEIKEDFMLHKDPFKQSDRSNSEDLSFNAFMKEIYYRLNEAVQQNIRDINGTDGWIAGYEFDEIANILQSELTRKKMKLQKTSGQWPLLLQKGESKFHPVILLKGLGSAIYSMGNCLECNQVPHGKSYFVSTVKSLTAMHDAVGLNLEKAMISGLKWDAVQESDPFACDKDVQGSWSKLHLQHLRRESSIRGLLRISEISCPTKFAIPAKGAVVFGKSDGEGRTLHVMKDIDSDNHDTNLESDGKEQLVEEKNATSREVLSGGLISKVSLGQDLNPRSILFSHQRSSSRDY